MKLVICTKRDLVSAVAINRLLERIGQQHEITLILSDKVSPAERSLPQSQDFVFYERDMAIDTVFELIDRSVSPTKHQPQGLLTFEGLAKHYKAQLHLWGNINESGYVEQLQQIQPDLLISIRYNYLFKAPVLQTVKQATLNLHPGLLPDYAGMYAPFHAMKNGAKELGCSLHYIDDEAVDAGAIIAQARYPADINKSIMWHFHHCYGLGMELIAKTIDDFSRGLRPEAQAQNSEAKAYYSYPTKQEFQAFEEMGGELISHRDYEEILQRFINPSDAT